MRMRAVAAGLASGLLLAACGGSVEPEVGGGALPQVSQVAAPQPTEAKGLEKIDHLIFVVMENRSFDHYFGTYPGADGLPDDVCLPHPTLGGPCMKPYHDTDQADAGGPHAHPSSVTSINGGKMDGFIRALVEQPEPPPCALDPSPAECDTSVGPDRQPDILGYHTREEIPLYWAYADNGVLQDRMFAPTDSWTLPAHLYLVSAWMAGCANSKDPMSCRPVPLSKHQEDNPRFLPLEERTKSNTSPYAWTDITWLLKRGGVSWAYYVAGEQECITQACAKHEDRTTTHQNPLPGFTTVRQAGQLENIQHLDRYFEAAGDGKLPSVSWVMPPIGLSEHPGLHRSIADGQKFVADVVNAAMLGPDWGSTAIFITWDDWGGFYDHVEPPKIDRHGYGLRVPGLMLSPYAKVGMIDHQTLTFDAYLKLIEDRFLGGARIDPETDGRPDPRPIVREDVKMLGDLRHEFDFDQPPRAPIPIDAEALLED